MRDEEVEKLNLEAFDEDEFMLKKTVIEPSPILEEDTIIDTSIEKDLSEKLEVMEEVTPIAVEEVDKKEDLNDVKDNKKKSKTDKVKKSKKIKKEKEKSSGFKFPKDTKGRVFYIIQAIFCLASIGFVVYCCIFYGSRLVKYYKVYNPKTENGEKIELIASTLNSNFAYVTEGDGIYKINGASLFKGENVNNYFKFGNHLWRIISVNVDGSVELALDGYINALSFNESAVNYKKSDINKYLNDVFLKNLNKDYLVETSYCLDVVEDINNVVCTDTATDTFVRLLGITEFFNSKIDGVTYLNSDDTNSYWTYNSASTGAWTVSGNTLSLVNSNNTSFVRPVIRIKNSVQLLGGNGSIEEPYYIEKETDELKVGDYIKLDNDVWIIYEVKDNTLNLALDKNLNNSYKFSEVSNAYDITSDRSLAKYLNTTYLDNLAYKDLINENEWYNGTYQYKYENVYKSTVKAKVGLYNVADMKFGNILEMYSLITPAKDGYTYFYDGEVGVYESKISLVRNVKPTININKAKIKSGKGTETEPYELEV